MIARFSSDVVAPDYATPKIRNRKGCPMCLRSRTSPEARRARGGLPRKKTSAEFIRIDDIFRQLAIPGDAHTAKRCCLTPIRDAGLGGIEVLMRFEHLVATGQAELTNFTQLRLPEAQFALPEP